MEYNKKKKRSFISLSDVRARMKMERFTPKKRLLNILVGSICIVWGAVTLPLPTGSLISLIFGSMLMFSPFSISLVIKQLYSDVKFKLWVLWERLINQ